FGAGTLLSALLNLPDILSSRRLFAVSAIAGAVVNASFGLFAHTFGFGVALRFMVGVFLAGVYPPGMKIMATWFRRGRGTALGVLVGALTLGKASPYLVNAVGSAEWRANVLFVSALAAAGGLVVLLFVGDGPFATAAAKFDVRQITRVFRNRGVRLANFGYFGHMWVLYALWAWAPVMIGAVLVVRDGVGRPALHGHGPHGADVLRVFADDRLDSTDTRSDERRRVALRLRRARAGARLRRALDAAPATFAGGVADSSWEKMTGRRRDGVTERRRDGETWGRGDGETG